MIYKILKNWQLKKKLENVLSFSLFLNLKNLKIFDNISDCVTDKKFKKFQFSKNLFFCFNPPTSLEKRFYAPATNRIRTVPVLEHHLLSS